MSIVKQLLSYTCVQPHNLPRNGTALWTVTATSYLATEVTMLVILGIRILYGISIHDQCTLKALFYNTLLIFMPPNITKLTVSDHQSIVRNLRATIIFAKNLKVIWQQK